MHLFILIFITFLILVLFNKFLNRYIPIILITSFFVFSYFVFTIKYTGSLKVDEIYYNRLVKSLNIGEPYIDTVANIFFQNDKIYKLYPYLLFKDKSLHKYYDLSYYKGKIYVYWGITPVILFYLPFNLIANSYLSDSVVAFILLSLIFIFSVVILLFVCDKFYKNKSNTIFLSCFSLIGFCNYGLYLSQHPNIYEIPILCAALLLLISIYLLIRLLVTNNSRNILIFFVSLCLSLAVGCRPHYFIFIPLFFIFVLFESLSKTEKNYTRIFKQILIFLMPCIVYGAIIATYNYVRFDSIFEFGFKYQLNHSNLFDFKLTIKDFLLGLQYHLLQCPKVNNDTYTVFSLVKATGHRLGNDLIAGLIYVYPLCLLILSVPFLLFSKINKNLKIIICLLSLIFLVNFCVACCFGATTNYSFEYYYIVVILSLILYLVNCSFICNSKFLYYGNAIIFAIVIYTVYINISLLFCNENVRYFLSSDNVVFYDNLIYSIFHQDYTISI